MDEPLNNRTDRHKTLPRPLQRLRSFSLVLGSLLSPRSRRDHLSMGEGDYGSRARGPAALVWLCCVDVVGVDDGIVHRSGPCSRSLVRALVVAARRRLSVSVVIVVLLLFVGCVGPPLSVAGAPVEATVRGSRGLSWSVRSPARALAESSSPWRGNRSATGRAVSAASCRARWSMSL